MTPTFAGLVRPILTHVLDLREAFGRGEHPSPESVKRGLARVFRDSEGRVRDANRADFDLARAALVYWTDEVLLKSAWRSVDAWKNNILELDVYGTRRAAVAFWERAREAEARALPSARSGPPPSADPLEVFFLCVALGFRGELFQDETEIETWARNVAPLLHADEVPGPPVPPAPRRGLAPPRGERLLTEASVVVAASAVLTLLGFIAAVHHRGLG